MPQQPWFARLSWSRRTGIERRILHQPQLWHDTGDLYHIVGGKSDLELLSSLGRGSPRSRFDRGAAGQLKRRSRREVRNEDAGTWILHDVAERVEHRVAGVIGPDQFLILNLDETRHSAPM